MLTAAPPWSSLRLRATSAATASLKSSAERVDDAVGAVRSACVVAGVAGAALLELVGGGEELILLLLVCLSGVGLLDELLTSFLLTLLLGLNGIHYIKCHGIVDIFFMLTD